MNLRQCDGDPCISYRIMKGQTLENKFEAQPRDYLNPHLEI